MEKIGSNYSIDLQILNQSNKEYTKNFCCGNSEIDSYFRNRAAKDKTAVTYMYIDTDTNTLIACVTISCSAIFTESDEEQSFSTILSAMEVKYLAVDENYQHIPYFKDSERPTLSDQMFDDMIFRMYELSHSHIGASKIVLYSVPQAVNFYRKHGFKAFGESMYGDEGYYVQGCKPMYFDLNW